MSELARKIAVRTGLIKPIAPARSESTRIQCMEVWGGNSAIETSVEVAGLDAWVCSQPYRGDHEGGDIHYVSTCGSGRVSRFVIADVSGHGSNAGEVAGRLKLLMRKHVNVLNMSQFAQELNREFAGLADVGRFATALLITYFAPTDHMVICNAGHPRPLWYHHAERRWELLDKDAPQKVDRMDKVDNLPLGIIEPTDYFQFAVRLAPGDMVVLYTDSLIESSAPDTGEQLGEAGLLRLLDRVSPANPEQFGRRILQAVADYRGGRAAEDDQTVLVLSHNGAEPPPMTRTWGAISNLARMVGLIDY